MAKVLVIDDEKIIRDRMKKLLELDDYETFSAESGQKGLEILHKEKPEIALVDIKMPGMDGIEVLKKIKENAEETEVIIITGHGGVDTAIQALKIGAFGYIQKPVDYDELEIEIKRALEKQEMRKNLNRYVRNLETAYSELDQIFNTAADGMRVVDKEFKILRINETFSVLSGFSNDEAVGKKCYEVFNGPVCHTPNCSMVRILGGEKYVEYDVEKEGKDGARTPCIMTAIPFVEPGGELIGIVQNYKDITERQNSEKEINSAHDKLESVYQQLQREHEIAEKVFEKVIRNDDHRNCPNIKFFQAPMTNVAGDLILIAAGPTGSQSIFLGDFTGHGLSAAIGAIPVSDIFYTMTEKGHSIADIVTEINRKLKNVLPTGLFLCACLMELDYTRGTLTLWNGGLPDALIIGARGGINRRLPSTHTPLGVVNNDKFDSSVEVVKVAQGERIYVYTDGIIEAVNNKEEMFGEERLEEHFVQDQAPERLFDEILNSFTSFRGEASQNDDITMVEVRYDIGKLCNLHWKTGSKLGKISKGWKMTLDLDPDDLRTNGALDYLIETLMGARRELRNHKENIYLILSELFTNAMDYGLLGLDPTKKQDPQSFEEYHATREINISVLKEGWIRIGLEVFEQSSGGERLVVRVEDSGSGFDYNKALPALSENLALGGRGIPLVRSLCQELVYEGSGNRVRAVYVLS